MTTNPLLIRCRLCSLLLISFAVNVQGWSSLSNVRRTMHRQGSYCPSKSNRRSFSMLNKAKNLVSLESYHANEGDAATISVVDATMTPTSSSTSKRALLSFAIPALGIYLTNPLLSNMDNAFVGKTVGVAGLAALSPATLCIDQMLYLFSFLSRATTGLVARAYGTDGNTTAARDAASARTYKTLSRVLLGRISKSHLLFRSFSIV
jgi:hypothetical protein